MENPTALSMFTSTSCTASIQTLLYVVQPRHRTAILKKSLSEDVPVLQHRSIYSGTYHMTRSPSPVLPSAAVSDHPTSTAPTRLQVPDPITCQFPVRCHPDFESVKEECDTWTLTHLLKPCSDADSALAVLYQAYLDSLFPLSVAGAFPLSATRERLLLITKLSVWLFFLDDTIDAADTETATEFGNAFMATLMSTYNSTSMENSEYEYKTRSGARLKRFVECFRVDVWEPMCQGMSPALQRRFVGEVLRSMNGMKKMWSLRQGKGLQEAGNVNEENMMALRLLDGFCWVYFVVLEYSLAVEMPHAGDGGNNHQKSRFMRGLMQNLKEAAGAHMICVNDMFSCGKEFALGDDRSSLTGMRLLAAERARDGGGGGGRAAEHERMVAEMWDKIQQQERLCADLVSQIRSVAGAEEGFPGHALSLMYAEAMCSLLSGHMYWTTRTGRYHGAHPVAWNTSPAYVTIPSSPLPALNILL